MHLEVDALVGADHARAAARLGKVVEKAVGEVDLTLPQYRMLAHLAGGTSAASVLAGSLAVSKPSLTALADGLVARGLVERHAAEGDRRRVDHVLTSAGQEALDAADAAVQARLDGLLLHLPRGARRRAVEGLGLWRTALDAARNERWGAR